VRWSVKLSLQGRERRWDLGDATLHEPDWYRALAREVRALCKVGVDPEDFIRRKISGVIEGPEVTEARDQKAASWTWEECVDKFLEYKAATRAIATVDDYRGKLKKEREWKPLYGKSMAEIDDSDVQKALDRITGRGTFGMAEGCFRVVRAMFSWAALPGQRKESGVAKHCLADVRPKDRPQITVDNLDEAEQHGLPVLPTQRELGRILAIAQSGVFPLSLSLAIELTLRSVQRRSTVSPCSKSQMEGILEADAPNVKKGHLYWTAWVIPPYFMKGRKATKSEPSTLPHLVPIPSDLAVRLDEFHRISGIDSKWYFPAAKPRRKGQPLKYPFMNPSTLSHVFLWMPGVCCSPQDLRRAFASYGPQVLGLSEAQTQLILDHTEGRGENVTSKFYDYREHLVEKIEMMAKWNAWLDQLADEARLADPDLCNAAVLRAKIEKMRGRKLRVPRKNTEQMTTLGHQIGQNAVQMLKTASAEMEKKELADRTAGGYVRAVVAELKKSEIIHEEKVLQQRLVHGGALRKRRRKVRYEPAEGS
jgi:integrase